MNAVVKHTELSDLADLINRAWENAEALAQRTVETYVMVGQYLLQARGQFPGDRQFGQWRKDQLPQISKEWSSRLMAVARKWGTDPNTVPQLPVSALAELVYAPDEVVEKVVEATEDGNKPTVKEIRKMVKDSKEPEPPADTPKVRSFAEVVEDSQSSTKPIQPAALSLEDEEEHILALDFKDRLAKHKSVSPWVVIGLSQFMENLPSRETIDTLIGHYSVKAAEFGMGTEWVAAINKLHEEL